MRTRTLALTEGAAAGILFGTAAIFIKLLQDFDAFYIAFWRLFIASLALAAVALALRKSDSSSEARGNLKDLSLLGLFLGLHFIFFVSAVKDTSILNATVLVNTTPMFSMIISRFYNNSKITQFAFLGMAISFAGVCIITYADASAAKAEQTVFPQSLKGDIEAVLAALIEAVYLNYGRKMKRPTSILSVMCPVYLLAAAVVGALGILSRARMLIPPFDVKTILPLVGLGILPTAVAHTLFFSSLESLKSFETATMALLEPVGATILGLILLMEAPGSMFVFGSALVMLGILFVIKERR